MVQAKRTAKTKEINDMDVANPNSYENILKLVLQWPPAMRTALAQEILKTSVTQEENPRPRKKTLHLALGLFDNGQPPPTDEEVEEWLDEYRMNKYGK